jgi:hypothetical protein
MIRSVHQRSLIAGVLASLAIAACGGERITGPRAGADAELMVSASVVGTPISTMVVEVSAEDISPSLIFNLSIGDGDATGTVKVPPGASRTFTIRAFDARGNVTHEGSATRDIRPGQNGALTVVLAPRAGHVQITVNFGSVSIAVDPTDLTLFTDETRTIIATVTTPAGQQITDAPEWATSNPAVASVTSDGLVTALMAGEADIVATYAGVAAVSHVTVLEREVIIGNTTEFTEVGLIPGNYLFGSAVVVSSTITLTHLALIGKEAGVNVRMALYTDLNGAPNQLVAGTETPPTPVAAGPVEIAISSAITLSPGTYWIMAISDLGMNVGIAQPGPLVAISPMDFGGALPTTFVTVLSFGASLNLYLKGLR